MRALLDTSVLIGTNDPGALEGAISAASLAELHFGVLAAADDDERARRGLRLGVIESTFEPLPIDAAVAREWGRLAAAVRTRGGQPRRRRRRPAKGAPPPQPSGPEAPSPAGAHSTSQSPPPPTSTTSRCSPTTPPTFRSSATSSTSTRPSRSRPRTTNRPALTRSAP